MSPFNNFSPSSAAPSQKLSFYSGSISASNQCPLNEEKAVYIAISKLSSVLAAFSIHNVLDMILESLDAHSLKLCRLVNKLWNDFALPKLKEKTITKLRFAFASESNALRNHDQYLANTEHMYENEGHYPTNRSAVQSLVSTLKYSDSFPCHTFIISTETLSSPQIQKVFDTIGRHAKHLKLSLSYSWESISYRDTQVLKYLFKLLSAQAPYLENFDLALGTPTSWPEIVGASDFCTEFRYVPGESFELPYLKYFKVSNQVPHIFAEKVLRAAKNLTEYRGFAGKSYFADDAGRNSVHILKQAELDFFPQGETIIFADQLLKRQNVVLQHIRLKSFGEFYSSDSSYRHKVVQTVNELLHNQCNNLRILELYPMNSVPGFRIPKMPMLTSLVLHKGPKDIISGSFVEIYFHQGFNLVRSMPILNSISISNSVFYMSEFDSDILVTLLDIPNPIESVKYLFVASEDPISSEASEALFGVFPNALVYPVECDF